MGDFIGLCNTESEYRTRCNILILRDTVDIELQTVRYESKIQGMQFPTVLQNLKNSRCLAQYLGTIGLHQMKSGNLQNFTSQMCIPP